MFFYISTSTGNIASEYSELGRYADEDRCCRDHDLCPHTLSPGKYLLAYIFVIYFYIIARTQVNVKEGCVIHRHLLVLIVIAMQDFVDVYKD